MRLWFLAIVLALFPAGASAQQATAPRTLLFIVDDLHMDFRTTPRMRDMLKRLIAEVVRDGDRFAIISTGHSSIGEPLTSDRTILDAAVNRVTGGSLRPEELVAVPAPADEIRHRARVSLSTAFEAISLLRNTQPASRAIILISGGYRVDHADLERALLEVIRVAREAGAPIYAFSPRDLFPQTVAAPDPNAWREYVRQTQAALAQLARETGGLAVVDPAGLEETVSVLRR